MRKSWRTGLIGFAGLVLGAVQPVSAYQRTPQVPPPRPDYSSSQNNNNGMNTWHPNSAEDASVMRELEEKRGKAMNSERQRMMVKEANQLMQAAAELQVGVTQGIDGAGREDQAKRAEAIEKLAKNVKERMKGSR